ncbi:MAG: bifunctional nuclease family protein [Pseudanabaenaceae cyanobacterium bins.39]|nr:bifunctional nuclease family protein [Pseudanabaenaceae cyanobacterium bins.39]
MIEMKVAGIAIDAVSRNPIVLLRDTLERRALPIWIGDYEAKAIVAALDGRPLERPMTHDLMLNFLDAWAITVERVVVHGLKNNTFYAVVTLVQGDLKKEVDARPSDAIAIAVRTKCPIWVMEEVILEASIPVDQDADEAERRAFREFLSSITPQDLVKKSGLESN